MFAPEEIRRRRVTMSPLNAAKPISGTSGARTGTGMRASYPCLVDAVPELFDGELAANNPTDIVTRHTPWPCTITPPVDKIARATRTTGCRVRVFFVTHFVILPFSILKACKQSTPIFIEAFVNQVCDSTD